LLFKKRVDSTNRPPRSHHYRTCFQPTIIHHIFHIYCTYLASCALYIPDMCSVSIGVRLLPSSSCQHFLASHRHLVLCFFRFLFSCYIPRPLHSVDSCLGRCINHLLCIYRIFYIPALSFYFLSVQRVHILSLWVVFIAPGLTTLLALTAHPDYALHIFSPSPLSFVYWGQYWKGAGGVSDSVLQYTGRKSDGKMGKVVIRPLGSVHRHFLFHITGGYCTSSNNKTRLPQHL
jgi:hypothetical protein